MKTKKIETKLKLCFSMAIFTFMILYLRIDFSFQPYEFQSDAFDWLKNRNNLSFFVPTDRDTALVVPSSITAERQRKLFACFVMSAPGNYKARNSVRQTWGKLIQPLFLIGVGDSEIMKSVTQEAEIFNDIIVEDFIDSYANLTLKTAFAIKWFVNHFRTSKFFFKIDDDVFLNVDKLYEMIVQAPADSLIGRMRTDVKPIRKKHHKWYVPSFLFDEAQYPAYFDGFYIIPGFKIICRRCSQNTLSIFLGPLVPKIYETSKKIPFMNMEDVFFTGQVAGKVLNYTLHDEPNFRNELDFG